MAAKAGEPIAMSMPDIDEADIEAIVRTARSGRLALGERAAEFERNLAAYVGVEHAICTSSGTAALHLIALALGLGPGDEVLVPSFTFAASVNAILYTGAVPVFVDIAPDTFNLDPADLEARITPRTRAVMAVDVFGHPADWNAIERISRGRGLHIADDSCEALGAEYEGRKLGGFGDAAAFAFYPNKQITTGEGGMIATNRSDLAAACRSLLNQGRGRMGARIEHERLGYNYRMDEMSAALGASQLKRIEAFLEKRRRAAEYYTSRLDGIAGVRPPAVRPGVRMSWFVYVAVLDEGIDRDRVIEDMEAQGVPVRGYFPPLHTQAYVRNILGGEAPSLPVTESAAARTLALPFHNNLPREQADRVVAALDAAIGRQG